MITLIDALHGILCEIQLGHLDEALESCGILLTEYPENPDGWHLKGLIHHLKGEQDAAVREISRAIRFAKTATPDMLMNRAAAYLHQGRWNAAITDLRKAVEIQPENAQGCLNLSYALNELHRFDEAEAFARRAAEAMPDSADAHANLARTLIGTRRVEEARTACETALRLNPGSLAARTVLGSIQLESGELSGAIESFEAALGQNRGNPALLANLGKAYEKQQRFEEAEAHFRMAVELAPETARYYLDLGTVLAARRRFAEAEKVFRLGLEKAPGHLELSRNLVLSLRDQAKFEEAEGLFRELVGRCPKSAALHAQFGLTLLCAERGDDAEAQFRKALELDPEEPDALFGKASILNGKREEREALSILQQILIREPDHLDSVRLLVSIHAKRKEINEARRWLQYLSRSERENPESLLFVGRTYADLGDSEAMIAAYKRAAAADPSHFVAAVTLSGALEMRNRLDEAAHWLSKAKSLNRESFLADYTEIRLLRQRKRYDEAVALAEASLKRPFEETDPRIPHEEKDARTLVPFELGTLLDRAGRCEEAFAVFTEANDARRKLYRNEERDRKALDHKIDGFKRLFQKTWVSSWTEPLSFAPEQTPVFLVGFPRSGTTLLGQILDSHGDIHVLEEPETIERVAEGIRDSQSGFGWTVANLEPADFIRLRNLYFRQVERHLPRREKKMLVEKMPLNLITAGVIHRIFPAAKFIFLKRHPCDACLSCFMQGFTINPAMCHFFNLDDTTAFYVRVMELWKQYRDVLKFPCYELSYEALLDDFDGQTKRLLEFIGADWDDSVRNYHTHAATRQDIITPSYRQVTQPIYKTAQDRWNRYAAHLQPYLDRLAPFIEAFGYSGADETRTPAGSPEEPPTAQ